LLFYRNRLPILKKKLWGLKDATLTSGFNQGSTHVLGVKDGVLTLSSLGETNGEQTTSVAQPDGTTTLNTGVNFDLLLNK
jgi:hypothetical protein